MSVMPLHDLAEESIPLETHRRIVEAMEMRHRADLGQQTMRLILYRQALEQAGLEPPDAEGEELLKIWRDCAAVISTASDFIATIGAAKELISERLGAPL